MREIASLAFSVALPWLAGALWVRAMLRQVSPPVATIVAGYGYLIGLFGITVVMRVMNLVGQPWTVAWIALAVVLLAAAAYWRAGLPGGRRSVREAFNAFIVLPLGVRLLFAVLVVLTCARVMLLGGEVLLSPLVPYDAFA